MLTQNIEYVKAKQIGPDGNLKAANTCAQKQSGHVEKLEEH